MPRHLILHIGLPKTGTTAIQRALASHRKQLRLHGICYPHPQAGAVPQWLHRAALAASRPGLSRGRDDRASAFMAALTQDVQALPPEITTLILSAEQCSLFLRGRPQITALRDLLAALADSVQVVLYLRRQDRHAASLYAQMLRRGRIAPPSLADIATELDGLYEYDTLLQSWADVFGSANITPRIFERADLPDGDVVADFLGLCGLPAAALPGRAPAEINASMNMEGQALLLAVGRHLQGDNLVRQIHDPVWTAVADLVSKTCPGPGWRPHQAEAAAFLARYAAGNEAVRAKWFPNRRFLFDPDCTDLPANPQILNPAPIETAAAIILAALRGTAEQLPLEGRRGNRAMG